MKSKITPQGCTNLKLRQLSRIVTRHYDHHLVGSGLKITQYSLLSYIVKLGPIQLNELAKHMQMDASTLTRNMQSLVAQGWVTINPSDNARSRLAQTTETGLLKRIEVQKAWKQAQMDLNERLGEETTTAMHKLLDRCIENLSENFVD